MPSPICEVRDSAGSFVSTTNGVNVTPGNTITIRLASTAGVNTWSIACITTDETTNAAAVTASLVVDYVQKTATFTAPAAGKALRFQSTIEGGIGPDGVARADYRTTFGIYTLAGTGKRVIAKDETFESDALSGWGAGVNEILRNGAPGGGATPGGSTGQIQTNDGAGGLGAIAHGAVGSVLRQTGATTQTFGQLDLADTDAVTGVLPAANQAAQTMSGDVTGTTGAAVVAKVNGVSYPSGAATVGQVPRVTGANTVAYGAVDLADADAITGVLPSANAPSHSGDVTGAHSATVVAKVNGATVPASGALTTGNTLFVSGPSALSYGALNLAGGSNYVTGLLPVSNQAAPVGIGFARVTSGAWDSIVIGETGTGNVVRATSPSLTTPAIVSGSFAYNIAVSAIAASRTITLPLLTGNDTFVFANFVQVLAGKTLTLPKITAGSFTYDFAVSAIAASRTITLPLLTGNDVFVFEGFAQTLSNKKVGTAALNWTSTVVSPTLSQDDDATNGVTGDALTIKAQSCTGTTSTGGDLNLAPGGGTSSSGQLNLQNPVGNTRITIKPTGTVEQAVLTYVVCQEAPPAATTTTNATPTDLVAIAVPDNAMTTYDIRVGACKDDSTAADAWVATITLRSDAGVITVLDAGGVADIKHRGSTAWSIDVGLFATTAIRVRVTGAAATTIKWGAQVSSLTVKES